jgi:phage head maturation protease
MEVKKKTLQQKLSTHFGVKIAENGHNIKAVNPEERTIQAVANTYFFIDSDMDMLVTGAATKSINDRGPASKATAKIKHQSDHILDTKNTVGRITLLEEREIEGNTVLYFESYIPETRKGNDDLINYQENVYDNHSIGFRYKQIELAVMNSANEMERKNWDEFYPKAMNPEVAEANGFFWVVKEIELFEISVVSYGANKLTPFLGSKSKDANDRIKSDLLERVDLLNAQLKSTASDKEARKLIDLEALQLKQIITELELKQPSEKVTPTVEPTNKDTVEDEDSKNQNLLTNISKFL